MIKPRRRRFWQFLGLVVGMVAILWWGQVGERTRVIVETPNLTPPDTSSPQATLTVFLDHTNTAYQLLQLAIAESRATPGLTHSEAVRRKGQLAEESLEMAARTLNSPDVTVSYLERPALEMVLKLKGVLDRFVLPPRDQIPDAAVVAANPDLVRWEIPNTPIALEKVESGPKAGEFLFAADTLEKLDDYYEEAMLIPDVAKTSPQFYEAYKATPGRVLPPKWSHWIPRGMNRLYGEQTLWQWLALMLGGVIALGVVMLLGWEWLQISEISGPWLARGLGVLMPLLLLGINHLYLSWLRLINITGDLGRFWEQLGQGITFLLWSWWVYAALNTVGSMVVQLRHLQAKPLEAAIVRNVLRLVGILAAITVIYQGAQSLGLPVTPLLASLGAGSLAVSLGAKPYIENILGGVALFINRSIQIGDYCEFGGVQGTVEDIGLRSTKLRTLSRTLITVPNVEASVSKVVNYSRRDMFLLELPLRLGAMTTRDRFNDVAQDLQTMIEALPYTTAVEIRLLGLDSLSWLPPATASTASDDTAIAQVIPTLNVLVVAYLLTRDFEESFRLRREVLLKIEHRLQALGIDRY